MNDWVATMALGMTCASVWSGPVWLVAAWFILVFSTMLS
jgi:hypothetical protein